MHALKREVIVFVTLLAVGVLVLPFPIYFVGDRVIGEYGPDATPFSLALDLWAALAGGHWAGWLLALTPYVFVQALRAAWRIWRGSGDVTHVTNPPAETRNWRV